MGPRKVRKVRKVRKFREMAMEVRIWVTKGFGWAISDSMRNNLAQGILKKGRGAIVPLIEDAPHILEEFPSGEDGWLSYMYVVTLPMRVDMTMLIEDNTGCLAFLAKRLYKSADIASSLAREVRKAIEGGLGEKDWFGISARLECVNVRLGSKQYVEAN